MRPLLVLGAVLSLCGGLAAGCQEDICKTQAPAIELALEPAAGLDLSSVNNVQVTIDSLLGKTVFDPLSVSAKQLAARPMTVKIAFASQSGAGLPQLPAGVELKFTVNVELLAGTQPVASGSVAITPSLDACNFVSVPLAAPSATPDAGAPDKGTPDSGIDAAPGPG